MSAVTFAPFDPDRAADEEFRAYYDLVMANHAVERAEMVPTSFEAYVARLRTMRSGVDPGYLWLAKEDGTIVAAAVLEFSLEENTHLAFVEIMVHPDRRREGIGTEFLKVTLAEARAAGRTRVMGLNVRAGNAGEPWAARVGFQPGLPYALQQLEIADVDRSLWDVPTPAGYRLVSWSGPAPEEIIASYAEARHAINDAVLDGLTWEAPDWTPERIRLEEAERAAADQVQYVAVAIHEASAKVGAITQLFIRNPQPTKGFQMDTAVVREHRGHGLGRAIKATMLRRLSEERPELQVITTQTADPVHMAGINLALGYRTLWTHSCVESDLDALERALKV
jgi:mycothiol synthase